MASPEQMGIDPEVKKAINDEGFEGDEYGGAAVIIGKKGVEVNNLKEKVENEGKCADAATYVRLNKVVAVPVEDISAGYSMPKKGSAWIGSDQCTFIDAQGNIATLIIDY